MKTSTGRGEDSGFCMINCTDQGIYFLNQFLAASLRDNQGNVANCIELLAEIQHASTDYPEHGKKLANDADIDAKTNEK